MASWPRRLQTSSLTSCEASERRVRSELVVDAKDKHNGEYSLHYR